MATVTTDSKSQESTETDTTLLPKKPILEDEEFGSHQLSWLCNSIVDTMRWHVVFVLVEKARSGYDIEKLLIKIQKLSEYGLIIDQKILEEAQLKYYRSSDPNHPTGKDENMLRVPEAFDVNIENLRSLHDALKKLEKKLKLKDRENILRPPPFKRSLVRRQSITIKAITYLKCIKERYFIRFEENEGERKFREFLRKTLLPNRELYNFIFRGKNKNFDELDSNGIDLYESFRKTKNVAMKTYRDSYLNLQHNGRYIYKESDEKLKKVLKN